MSERRSSLPGVWLIEAKDIKTFFHSFVSSTHHCCNSSDSNTTNTPGRLSPKRATSGFFTPEASQYIRFNNGILSRGFKSLIGVESKKSNCRAFNCFKESSEDTLV